MSGRISRNRNHTFAFVLQHAKQNLYEKTENETSEQVAKLRYEGWNFNSGNYLFTTDTK